MRSPSRFHGRHERLLLLLLLLFVTFVGPTGARMHASERRHLREKARAMFYHGYNSYMEHAFPWDELKPLSCEGRRWDQRERGDLDDVLGGYALTLVDSLDTLAVLGDRREFARAVRLVIEHVHFDRDVTVSVFEATIRVIGGLLSAHLVASPRHLGVLSADEYDDELLALAVDLGRRLLPAFETPTRLPVHRVHLQRGITAGAPTVTCPAAAGSLLVEFSYLSRLSGVATFETTARDAVLALWRRRSALDLLGSAIDVVSGEWLSPHVGIGAGVDSFFEYLLKYHLVTGSTRWLDMFNASYHAVETHVNHDDLHFEVDMHHGRGLVRARRVSALQAFWPGLQVLAGDVSRAMRGHDKLFSLWNRFGAMPELVDMATPSAPGVVHWARTSPLRPELIESTYHLFQATRDHKYLKIGRKLLEDMERVSRVPCGYAAVGDIHTLRVEDRMDSYFLSETVKYLYLLFGDDPDEIVPPMELPSNGSTSRPLKSADVVFSTEGHVLLLDRALFDRAPGAAASSSSDAQAFACENVRSRPPATAAATEIAYVPVGVSVRQRDAHVATMVAAPATFGLQLGHTRAVVEAPLSLLLSAPSEPQSPLLEACTPLTPAQRALVRGRVVLVRRGACAFARKALVLQDAGAAGVVIVNNRKTPTPNAPTGRQYVMMDDRQRLGASVQIPVVMISMADAAELRRLLVLRAAADADDAMADTRGRNRSDDESSMDDTESQENESGEIVVALSAWLH
ncbi:hypothetical protein PINS_up015390 [Pythium insidiosum]|nr:hypothetical protein PINS_up015390 [Pythium insidiosum]